MPRALPGPATLLESVADDRQVRPRLGDLLPNHAGYFHLYDHLTKYRRIATQGRSPSLPPGPVLWSGDGAERVATHRGCWEATRDYEAGQSADTNRFNSELQTGVALIQRRHGLDADVKTVTAISATSGPDRCVGGSTKW